MMVSKQFSIKVLGAFDLFDSEGRSIRPSGRKDCALIAMLALTRNHRQTRTWLQDKLWGDRGPAQAAASLRQCLTTLRTLFDGDTEALCADRTWVWLDPKCFNFDHAVHGVQGEVLRGFDLREEGFDDWLRQCRAEFEARDNRWGPVDVPDQQDRRWYIEAPAYPVGEEGLAVLGELVCESILEALSVVGLHCVFDCRSMAAAPSARAIDMVVRTRVLRIGPHGMLSVVVANALGSLQWQIRREIAPGRWNDLRATEIEIVQALQDFATRTEAESLRGPRWTAHANGCQALMGMLVPGSVPTREMVRCCEAAIAMKEKGIYHALLGLSHLQLYGERETLGPTDLAGVMQSFRTAMKLSPDNGLVLALAGHAYGYFMRDLNQNSELTQAAVRQLPGSGICWDFFAISLGYSGKYSEAVDAATKAVNMSRGTVAHPLARSTELFARLMAGDTRGAICAGEISLDSIVFRPTIVDLMTAYAQDGQTAAGREKLDLLIEREPDLCIQMLKAPDYPIVNQSHRAAVVDAARMLGLR